MVPPPSIATLVFSGLRFSSIGFVLFEGEGAGEGFVRRHVLAAWRRSGGRVVAGRH